MENRIVTNPHTEFNLIAIYSGNGEDSCLAIDKESFKKIYQNQGMIDDEFTIEHWWESSENWYKELANGEKLYNIYESGLLDMFFIKRYYRDNKGAVGFRAKVIVEPVFENEVREKSE